MKKPLITISVISHGDASKVGALLHSLLVHESDAAYQCLITDNLGNEDFSNDIFSSATIFYNQTPKGFAENHNAAFQHAQGEYFCILNPDIVFIEPIFSPLIKRLEKNASIISPIIVDSENTIQDSFRDYPTPLRLLKRKLPGYRFQPSLPDESGLIYPDWIAGMFMLMRSENYNELGGFDEKFHLYFEDVDICARARSLGLPPLNKVRPIVDTNLRIQHNAQRASRKKIHYLLWHFQSAMRFFSSQVYKDIKRKK